MAIGKPVAFEASAEERDTRGFISITTIAPFFGLMANCTLEPPVSTPISRKTAMLADALVATSAELLERVGSRFAAKVESEAGKLVDIGASVAGGALEVASLGEAFGHAVRLFSDSNEKMMTALQRIEGGLAKSLTRSDEQLAYYVAQAREVIELSILSQKKMVDDLQRAGRSEA